MWWWKSISYSISKRKINREDWPTLRDLLLRRNPITRLDKGKIKDSRGMAFFTDLLDWLGGYPFEVAKPEEVFDFFRARGFNLLKLKTEGSGHGNNEFVFLKCAE